VFAPKLAAVAERFVDAFSYEVVPIPAAFSAADASGAMLLRRRA
jgi:hypothetical protein